MSFGFSVGDFIAVGGIVADIISCLNEARGAKSDYQELVRELECLQQALQHLDKLEKRSGSSTKSLDSIKYAALSCRRPLEEFLQNAKKYNKSLGLWSKNHGVTAVRDKLNWSFGDGKQEATAKLQSYLSVHVGTINILLAEHGLEQLELAGQKADLDHASIYRRIEDTRKIVENIQNNVAAQKLVVVRSKSMLQNLCEMVSGELSSSWRSLTDMVSRVCVSTQQIYGVVLRIEASLLAPDIRRTFFQDPLAIEDAEGVRFPVFSEYDFNLVDDIIKLRFKIGPLSKDVSIGNYELFQTSNGKEVITPNTRLLPGTAITMALLVRQKSSHGGYCPMPRCGSDRSLPVPGGGRLCCDCEVWFASSSKKRKRLVNLLGAVDEVSRAQWSPGDGNDKNEPVHKRARLVATETDLRSVKNVRSSEEEMLDELEEKINETEKGRALPSYKDAIHFVNRLKAYCRSSRRIGIYNEFLEILQTYQRDSIPLQDTHAQVAELFGDALVLLQDFQRFLPKSVIVAETTEVKPSNTEWAARDEISDDDDDDEEEEDYDLEDVDDEKDEESDDNEMPKPERKSNSEDPVIVSLETTDQGVLDAQINEHQSRRKRGLRF